MTSLLLDAGDGVTHCIPVVDGFCLEHCALRLNMAGRHVTDYLVKLLFMR
jgi:actin-related protein 2